MQARARFKEGVDFYDKGQYENARLAFLQAYALKKHPAVLLNLAQSSAKAGHHLEAAKAFQQFLRESTSVSAQQRQDAEGGLAEVRQKLGRIEIIAPAGTEITLDEKEKLGTAPFNEPIDVEAGSHSLRSSSETVRVSPNAGQKVQARFGGGVAPIVPVTPPPITPPPSNPPPSEPLTPPPETGRGKPLPMWPAYVGIGVAGVGLGLTIIFAAFKADSQSKADAVASSIREAALKPRPPTYPNGYDGDGDGRADAKGICTSTDATIQKDFGNACKTLKENNDKVDTNATLANVGIGVLVVGAVFTAAWFIAVPIINRNRERAGLGPINPPVLRPYAAPKTATNPASEGGLILSGSF